MNQIIDKFQKCNILVIGDIILDKYIFGDTSRINPEAPVPIVKVEKVEHRLGGAANVANNITSLDGNCTLIGQVGNDENKKILEKELIKNNINHFFIENKNFKTIKKTRIISQNQHLIRIDHENPKKISDKDADSILNFINNKKFNLIVISDYNKGLITPYLMEKLKILNIRIIADFKPQNINLFKDCFLITPNLKEAEEITKEKKINKILNKLHEITNSNIILTCGEKGAYLFKKEKQFYLPSKAKEVYDVSGAGDTFIATVALAIASNSNLYESVILGNQAAGIVIGKLGTAILSPTELKKSLNLKNNKIKNVQEIKTIIKKAKKQSKKVVFTNGCFDILHVGHTKLLNEAKSFGDILILGLNTDNSIRKLKGSTRPINNQEDRAEVLSNLESIDHIVFFDEISVFNLVKKLLPNILVKGGDYKECEVVGADLVKKHGGEVKLVKIVQGKSTTNIINKTKVL